MTLIKSLLLGSAAGIVAVATAQAADLPTRKAAPVEYVRVCNVGGITGWTLPGSDTCVKFSGYVTAQFEGGNLNTQYNWLSTSILAGFTGIDQLPFGAGAFHSARARRCQPGSREHDFLSSRDRLVDPRQLVVRHGLQHRLRAVDRPRGHQLGGGERLRRATAAPHTSTPAT